MVIAPLHHPMASLGFVVPVAANAARVKLRHASTGTLYVSIRHAWGVGLTVAGGGGTIKI